MADLSLHDAHNLVTQERRYPVTYLLLAVILGGFILQHTVHWFQPRFMMDFTDWTPAHGYTVLTYMVIHLNPYHLLLNASGLLVFGRITEEQIGGRNTLVLYLLGVSLSGILMLWGYQMVHEIARVGGASAGNLALIGYVLVAAPRSRLFRPYRGAREIPGIQQIRDVFPDLRALVTVLDVAAIPLSVIVLRVVLDMLREPYMPSSQAHLYGMVIGTLIAYPYRDELWTQWRTS